MSREIFKKYLLSPWRIHLICCAVAVFAGIFILWPRTAPRAWRLEAGDYAGIAISAAFLISLGLLLLVGAWLLLRLRNTKAFIMVFSWLGLWGGTTAIFMFLALIANPPPPMEKELPQPIQQSDTLHIPHDYLVGPDALLIPITPENYTADKIVPTPALSKLERDNQDILQRYISTAPRWAHNSTYDTFYTKPGHVVLEPPTSLKGTPGHIHVTFRTLAEGQPVPAGYSVVRPGGDFPSQTDDNDQIPDLALDLGGSHYLLLAWRGAAHRETAYKAINAAISAIDARFEPLAHNPSAETIDKMITGKRATLGTTPEMRLCEPPAQYGTYQAELFLNPGEEGTILLIIKDLEKGETLCVLNCPAQYSNNENELFRHDIPGAMPDWMRSSQFRSVDQVLFPGSPLFIIRKGESHHYFGAAFEVWFSPAGNPAQRKLIMRRCYKVQAYELDDTRETSPNEQKNLPTRLPEQLAK